MLEAHTGACERRRMALVAKTVVRVAVDRYVVELLPSHVCTDRRVSRSSGIAGRGRLQGRRRTVPLRH